MATPFYPTTVQVARRVSIEEASLHKRHHNEEEEEQERPCSKRRCTGELPVLLQAIREGDAKQGAMALRQLYSYFLYDPRRISVDCVWQCDGHLDIVHALQSATSEDFHIIALTVLHRLCEHDTSYHHPRTLRLVQAGCLSSAVTSMHKFPNSTALVTVALRLIAKLLDARLATTSVLDTTVTVMRHYSADPKVLLQACHVLGQLGPIHPHKRVFEHAGVIHVLEGIIVCYSGASFHQASELIPTTERLLHWIHSLEA